MKSVHNIFLLVILSVSLTGCISNNRPTPKPVGYGWYSVKLTDTLYSIAWRYGLDYKQLAQWNKIDVDSIIIPGQRLLLVEPETLASSKIASGQKTTVAVAKENQPPAVNNTTSTVKKVVKTSAGNPNKWLWPVKGKVLNSFSAKQLDRRGIDIAGNLGQPIQAAADGKVVYSGNGLVGYGNLIIIKHSNTYLSAYAYCKERLVTEGMNIKAGHIIAKMGNHKSNSARLHFEIRVNGKPVDPMQYLAKQ